MQDSSGFQTPCTPKVNNKMQCGKGRGTCPAEVEARLQEYSETTQQLVNIRKPISPLKRTVKQIL